MEPDQRPAIVRPWSRSAPDRRARPGSHSRPSYSRCRTARARRSAGSRAASSPSSTKENRPVAPREIAPPMFVARAIRQRGMEHARHLAAAPQPARDLEPVLLVPPQPHVERPQAPQRQPGIVRPGGLAEHPPGPAPAARHRPRSTVTEPSIRSAWPPIYLVQARIERSIPAAIAGKKSGVAQVLSSSVTRPRAFAAAQIAGHVLHLEAVRARAFHEDRPGLLADQRGDAGADQRIVIAGGDAEPLQHACRRARGSARRRCRPSAARRRPRAPRAARPPPPPSPDG